MTSFLMAQGNYQLLIMTFENQQQVYKGEKYKWLKEHTITNGTAKWATVK